MLEPGKIIGDTFRVEKELGSGAMGTVWKAVYTKSGKPVAIKAISLSYASNETAIARFEREAEILKQLRHPHIVGLFGTFRYKKMPFIAMDFVEGESLDKIFERRGRLPWEEVVRLGRQLCKALQHAHEKGIIHRDLKPSNLMIAKDGTLKLTDFGIAKDTDVTALTGANSTVGTAAYMSPEQCKGERNLTLKSDLYSLGVVFYELLTGEKPFKKDSPVEMFLAHVNEPVERPSRKVLDIPPWLDTLVCQLMEKKPEHRPYDAAMVISALNEIDEKMAEQKSAGLDFAEARNIDRAKPVGTDNADKEAARLLRGASRKKKMRTKPKAFYEKAWFLAVSVPAVLAGAVAVFWWMTRPPSAESFYRRADAALQAGNKDAAREILKEFADTYPDLADANAERLRQWREDLAAEQTAKAMHRRMRHMPAEGEAMTAAYAAFRHEDAGEVEKAHAIWRDLAATANTAKGEDLEYAWLGKKQLRELNEVDRLTERFDEQIDADSKTASDAERATAEARRAERFGDVALAVERYGKIKDEYSKEIERRVYAIYAAKMHRALKQLAAGSDESAKNQRLKNVKKRLTEIDVLLHQETEAGNREAARHCRDLIALYGKDSDAALAPFVDQARQKLARTTRPKN